MWRIMTHLQTIMASNWMKASNQWPITLFQILSSAAHWYKLFLLASCYSTGAIIRKKRLIICHRSFVWYCFSMDLGIPTQGCTKCFFVYFFVLLMLHPVIVFFYCVIHFFICLFTYFHPNGWWSPITIFSVSWRVLNYLYRTHDFSFLFII